MPKEAHHHFTRDNGYIAVGDRTYVAKKKFTRFKGAGYKWNVEPNGFERNKAGEILYALPGTDETATERELRGE